MKLVRTARPLFPKFLKAVMFGGWIAVLSLPVQAQETSYFPDLTVTPTLAGGTIMKSETTGMEIVFIPPGAGELSRIVVYQPGSGKACSWDDGAQKVIAAGTVQVGPMRNLMQAVEQANESGSFAGVMAQGEIAARACFGPRPPERERADTLHRT